jgi:hypothetical protein
MAVKVELRDAIASRFEIEVLLGRRQSLPAEDGQPVGRMADLLTLILPASVG